MASLKLAKRDITFFAKTNFRNEYKRFGIKTEDRRKHIYVVGKTGMGKTNLLETMAISDIQKGKGVCILDPHGEFTEKMLDYVPRSRINDVLYFNPADLDYPIAFNLFEKVEPSCRHLVASGIMEVFKKIWKDVSWGPRLEYILRNCILTLLERPQTTLLDVQKLLVNEGYRKRLVLKLKDPVLRNFWQNEFENYPDRFQKEAIVPIQNKVGQFLTSPLIRNIVGQTKTSFNLREVMDKGKILILNLSKGKIGEDNSQLLGAMMITKLYLAAMSRVDIPEEKRKDFFLYCDEFQNFATDSFASILSEARKYKLNLVIAHQYINQLSEKLEDSVFGNVGTIISFRVGPEDSEYLEGEFNSPFEKNDLMNLPKYHIYLKLMVDGTTSHPFSALTFPSFKAGSIKGNREKIIKVSRRFYAKEKNKVEAHISKMVG